MGKGSKRRPTLVDEETFEERWERTFGRKERNVRDRLMDGETVVFDCEDLPPCPGFVHDSVCGCGCNDEETAPITTMTIFPPIHHDGGRGRR